MTWYARARAGWGACLRVRCIDALFSLCLPTGHLCKPQYQGAVHRGARHAAHGRRPQLEGPWPGRRHRSHRQHRHARRVAGRAVWKPHARRRFHSASTRDGPGARRQKGVDDKYPGYTKYITGADSARTQPPTPADAMYTFRPLSRRQHSRRSCARQRRLCTRRHIQCRCAWQRASRCLPAHRCGAGRALPGVATVQAAGSAIKSGWDYLTGCVRGFGFHSLYSPLIATVRG